MRRAESFPVRSEPSVKKESLEPTLHERNSEPYLPYIESEFLPNGVRIIHVTDYETMPREGLICASGVLLGDPTTGIYTKAGSSINSSEWRRAYVLVPHSPRWVKRMFSRDVHSQRNSKLRFIPKNHKMGTGGVREKMIGNLLNVMILKIVYSKQMVVLTKFG